MRRRATLAATLAALVGLAAAPGASAPAPSAPQPTALSPTGSTLGPSATTRPAVATPTPPPPSGDPAAGLAWTLPAGWRAVGPRLTALAEPVHRLAAATFDLRQDKPDRDCTPDTARRRLPAHGALVYLLESRESAASPRVLAKLPPRPARFRLPAATGQECLGGGRIVTWTEHGRSLQARVLLGRRAGATRRAQVEALLNSLAVQPIAPPPPPAGWRFAISAADSLRVPPGWSAYALERQRGVARPRLLFRIADERVVLRVVEHRRGPTSSAFPPAREPLVFDARRRAGMSFRGYRISLRIFARPGATARDLRLAEISARTLGVSDVGRG